MKKIDFLIIRSFIGPFILTTAVVVFIFLMRFIMLYFDDFVGKDLGLDVFAKLFSYFSLITIPISLPLATLLASLMCFGNLGEYSELTAIKSAGIPIVRVLIPAMIFSLFVSLFSLWFNNSVSPKANLKGYSLLWDVKTTKVTLNLKEGIFYKEIPGYTIKALKKFPDGKTLKYITIYDHSKNDGNTSVTVADSGKMYTILKDNYLVFELFNGNNYNEFRNNSGGTYNDTQFLKNSFRQNKLVFSLESFGMKRTDENQFKYHEYMKDIPELRKSVDSLSKSIRESQGYQLKSISSNYNFHLKKLTQDTTLKDTVQAKTILAGAWIDKKLKELTKDNKENIERRSEEIFETAKMQAKSVKDQFDNNNTLYKEKKREIYRAEIEMWHKFTLAFACFVMFLIGASLGSIIKKGGFGMPVLLAITFFIFMYVLMQLGDKYAREGIIPVIIGVWIPDALLLLFGIFFIYKASNDARLFEGDVYYVYFDKLKSFLKRKGILKEKTLA